MRLAEMARMGNGVRVLWSDLNADEPEGEPQRLLDQSQMTVTIDGGQARLQGKNHEGGEWHDLPDSTGIPLKGPGIALVTLNPWLIRPVLVAGDRVTVCIVATKGG